MIRSLTQITSLITLSLFLVVSAAAQDKFKEIKLTEQHIQNYIKADPHLQKVFEKIENSGGKPNSKLLNELEKIATKYNFKSFHELELVSQTVSFIMTGFDVETGEFTEPRQAMEEEIEALKKDDTIPEKERQNILQELENSIKTSSNIQFKSNIDLIKKHMIDLEKIF